MDYVEKFNQHFSHWLRSACVESGVAEPGEEFVRPLMERLGPMTTAWIGYGLQRGLVTDNGNSFSISNKGKWKWFSKKRPAPRCNWEAFLHVASYLRLFGPCAEHGLELRFEDNGMDLTVRQGAQLLWYIEVKEQKNESEGLIASLKLYGEEGVDLSIKDKRIPGRKRDTSLPKAKYLVKYQPKYFSVVALGYECHFRNEPGIGTLFTLAESAPPFEMLTSPTRPTTA